MKDTKDKKARDKTIQTERKKRTRVETNKEAIHHAYLRMASQESEHIDGIEATGFILGYN